MLHRWASIHQRSRHSTWAVFHASWALHFCGGLKLVRAHNPFDVLAVVVFGRCVQLVYGIYLRKSLICVKIFINMHRSEVSPTGRRSIPDQTTLVQLFLSKRFYQVFMLDRMAHGFINQFIYYFNGKLIDAHLADCASLPDLPTLIQCVVKTLAHRCIIAHCEYPLYYKFHDTCNRIGGGRLVIALNFQSKMLPESVSSKALNDFLLLMLFHLDRKLSKEL